MHNLVHIFRDELRRFDGLTLFLLLMLSVIFLTLPIWLFVATLQGSATVFSPPLWLDILIRLVLAGFFALRSAHYTRRVFNVKTARLGVISAWLIFGVVLIAILHFSGVINIIPG